MISRLHAILPLGAALRAGTTIMGAALLALGLLAGPAGAQQDSGFLADRDGTPAADYQGAPSS